MPWASKENCWETNFFFFHVSIVFTNFLSSAMNGPAIIQPLKIGECWHCRFSQNPTCCTCHGGIEKWVVGLHIFKNFHALASYNALQILCSWYGRPKRICQREKHAAFWAPINPVKCGRSFASPIHRNSSAALNALFFRRFPIIMWLSLTSSLHHVFFCHSVGVISNRVHFIRWRWKKCVDGARI